MQPRVPSAFFDVRTHSWFMFSLVSTGIPRSFPMKLLFFWAHPGAKGCSTPGLGLCTSPSWTSWDSCQPISPACWCLSVWLHGPLASSFVPFAKKWFPGLAILSPSQRLRWMACSSPGPLSWGWVTSIFLQSLDTSNHHNWSTIIRWPLNYHEVMEVHQYALASFLTAEQADRSSAEGKVTASVVTQLLRQDCQPGLKTPLDSG